MRAASDFISGHRSLVLEGNKRAIDSGKRVLISLTQPFPQGTDPLRVFCAGLEDGVRNFWACPSEQRWIVGGGEATQLCVTGSDRFREADSLIQNLFQSATIQRPEPVLMGGFRFRHGSDTGGIWAEFPDGLLTLPAWQVVSESPGHSWLLRNVISNGDIDYESLRGEMSNLMIRLSREPDHYPDSMRVSWKEAVVSDHWTQNVKLALNAIEQGELSKVTLARTLTVKSEAPIMPEAILQHLLDNYPECHIFAFCRKGTSFVGASPEELVKYDGSTVTSTCLAGTALRGKSADEDARQSVWLLASKKERAEHKVVVDWVTEHMAGLCESMDRDPMPYVMKLGNVQHLATRFVGTPKRSSRILELVDGLHPTPAVGGYPLTPALEMIQRLEESDRGWYTGPVGWVDKDGRGAFAIAIRCALLRNNEAFLYAGAGIVSGSSPESEHQETMMKFRPLLTALGL